MNNTAESARHMASDDCTASVDPYAVRIGGVLADPYRIARSYGISDPIVFQALKKLLRCGRKHKDLATDIREAILTLERWEELNAEDLSPNAQRSPTPGGGQ